MTADAQLDVVEVRAVDDLLDGLVDDDHGGGDDEQRLDDAGDVLDLLVAVVVARIGRLGGARTRPGR